MYITIERISEDGLEKREWRFTVWQELWGALHLRLRYYFAYTRPTRRHNWRNEDAYSGLTDNMPPPLIPPDVLNELTEKLIEAVKAAVGEMK